MAGAGGVDFGVEIPFSILTTNAGSGNVSWTPAGAADDPDKFTIAVWLKRGIGNQTTVIFEAGADQTNRFRAQFNVGDTLSLIQEDADAEVLITTDQVFRDPTAWYHFVFVYDSANATADDRMKMYVNGVEITSFGTRSNPSSAQNGDWGSAVLNTVLESGSFGGQEFDGCVADFYSIDGLALTPTSFGKFNGHGHWVPALYTGAFGTNGYHLDFAIAPGTGNGAGEDVSGEANHLAESGLSADRRNEDTPTRNHCVLNAVDQSAEGAFTFGSMDITYGSTPGMNRATFFLHTGKWYWEVDVASTQANGAYIGVAHALALKTAVLGADNFGWGLYNISGTALNVRHNAADIAVTDVDQLLTSDYVMVAYDADSGKLWFGINGTFLDSGDPAAGTGEQATTDMLVAPAVSGGSATTTFLHFRPQDQMLEGTIPTGFRVLNVREMTVNGYAPLPKGERYFDIIEIAGDGTSARSVGALDFKPSMVLYKDLDLIGTFWIHDTARGITTAMSLVSGGTDADHSGDLPSVEQGGIVITNAGNLYNLSNFNYLAYCFNVTLAMGLDIILYTGTGVAKNEAHSLGRVPDHIWYKTRTAANAYGNYHDDLLDATGAPISDPETDFLQLSEDAVLTDDATMFDDTAPDASNVRVGTNSRTNDNTESSMAYVWAGIPGFSHFGSYNGNASTDGPFLWCNGRPKFVVIKKLHASAQPWIAIDAVRANSGTLVTKANPRNGYFEFDSNAVEAFDAEMDFLANGIKLRTTNGAVNDAKEYIYMVWNEHPLRYAKAF